MEWRLIVLPVLSMFACQSSDAVSGEQKEFLTDAPPADTAGVSYDAFPGETGMTLANYFEPTLLTKLDQYVQGYNTMATEADFEKNYNEGMGLFPLIYEALTDPKTDYLKARFEELKGEDEYFYPVNLLDEYEKMNGMLGPVVISCAAECTDLDFLFDLEAMTEKAKTTAGKADEDFMELVMYIEASTMGYASYPGFKVWFVQTWDYGGYSMLGNGVFTDAVKRTQAYEKKYKLFAPQVAAMREDFVSSLKWDGSFGLSKEEVLDEFDDLLKMDFFTKEDKVQMREGRAKIESNTEGYQFGCESGDCVYG